MTTASAEHVEKSRASTDPKRRGGRASSEPSYLVLIRLPTVREDEAEEVVAATPGEPQETLSPKPEAMAAAPVSPATPEAVDAPATATPRDELTSPTQSTPRFGPERLNWSRFQGVRLLGQLFVGLLVIGLCVAAYLMIVGGHDAPSTAKNPETPAVDQQAADDSVPETRARDAAEQQASPAADAKTKSLPTAVPATAPADQEAAAPAPTGRQDPDYSSPSKATPASSQSLLETGLAADPATPSPDLNRQDARVPADMGNPAEFAGGPRPSAPDSQLPLIEQPGRASYPGQPNPAGPSAPSYPVTDPGKFLYPPQYHESLRSRANTGPTADSSTGPVGRSAQAWQPNTARLQPSMDPPPIR